MASAEETIVDCTLGDNVSRNLNEAASDRESEVLIESEDRSWDLYDESVEEHDNLADNRPTFTKAIKLLKVLVYLITFSIVLVSAVISKGTLLLLTSVIDKSRTFRPCNITASFEVIHKIVVNVVTALLALSLGNCNALTIYLPTEGTTDRRGRSHPPQCTTSREDRQIVRMSVTDFSVTSRTIAQHIEFLTHHSVSARTIRRHLQQSVLSARRPLLGLLFTQNPDVSTANGAMKERCGWQNGMKLSLLTNNSSVCNTTMVGFESGDTVERGC
ncbi:HTH_38 domain-containing protein [Trichonephila clavipes]|nr:HTH_38 domain-containing protein [Trichonephila clavipes]